MKLKHLLTKQTPATTVLSTALSQTRSPLVPAIFKTQQPNHSQTSAILSRNLAYGRISSDYDQTLLKQSRDLELSHVEQRESRNIIRNLVDTHYGKNAISEEAVIKIADLFSLAKLYTLSLLSENDASWNEGLNKFVQKDQRKKILKANLETALGASVIHDSNPTKSIGFIKALVGQIVDDIVPNPNDQRLWKLPRGDESSMLSNCATALKQHVDIAVFMDPGKDGHAKQ
jgi:hypothetical protein